MSHGYGKLQWRLLAILSKHERTASRAERELSLGASLPARSGSEGDCR
jgi:hypothetical protein